MENATNTVAAIFADDRETFRFHEFLNGCTEGTQTDAWFHHSQRQIEALLRDTAQTLAQNSGFADDKHFRRIAMVLIFNHRHVDVDDIAIFELFFVVRNAVTNHFINRDADGFREAVIAKAGGDGVLFVNDIVITDTIQLTGAYAGLNVRLDHFQHFGGETAGDAHFFNFFWSLY